jgi:hypothetical protein
MINNNASAAPSLDARGRIQGDPVTLAGSTRTFVMPSASSKLAGKLAPTGPFK